MALSLPVQGMAQMTHGTIRTKWHHISPLLDAKEAYFTAPQDGLANEFSRLGISDALRTAVSDSGMSMKKLHEISNVSNSTMSNWFKGKTKRPQFCTVSAVARAAGKKGIRWSGRNGAPELID